ncbi:MAG: hypothetical protein KTR14_03840 [Vampirovibrio sp.]|nr:hypothetical protein [Vampirovibrio sp.]
MDTVLYSPITLSLIGFTGILLMANAAYLSHQSQPEGYQRELSMENFLISMTDSPSQPIVFTP